MAWYKVETKRPTYRTYHIEADSPENAEEKLYCDLERLFLKRRSRATINERDYQHVDEWIANEEEIISDDTEEIDEEDANIHTIRYRGDD